jgi:hypothetical protein
MTKKTLRTATLAAAMIETTTITDAATIDSTDATETDGTTETTGAAIDIAVVVGAMIAVATSADARGLGIGDREMRMPGRGNGARRKINHPLLLRRRRRRAKP